VGVLGIDPISKIEAGTGRVAQEVEIIEKGLRGIGVADDR